MNCQDFEKTRFTLARNQLLDATTREQSLAHAEVCVQCAARLAEERALLAGLRLVVAAVAKEEAPACVEAVLLTAFRAQAERSDTSAIRPLSLKRSGEQWRVVAAWAAVILLAVLLGARWLKRSAAEQQQAVRQSPASSTPRREVPVPNGAANVDEPKLAGAFAVRPRPKTRRGVHPVAMRESEIATRFYLLVEEGELASLESGRVVRVEVPISALIALGLPITAEGFNQPVQADLLLGQDGLARAIRFSSEGLIPSQSQTKTQ